MAEKIKCSECESCKDNRRYGNTRGSFFCEHADQKYILDYFKKHKIQKMPAFIGFGKIFEEKPSIKTSPAWCPKKKKEGQ